jgi:cyclopropane fatty-acyl-phospholipid synthase-like methyltransferase
MQARHNLSLLVWRALGEAYDFSKHNVLLDIGGGTGAYCISLCQSYAHLSAIVFDLPPVAQMAYGYLGASGLSNRIEVRAGDFKDELLPEGFDVALLADLLSVATEESNRELLRKVYGLLPAGGVVIISGWILDDTRTGPSFAASMATACWCCKTVCASAASLRSRRTRSNP